jgi:hypothetical protein
MYISSNLFHQYYYFSKYPQRLFSLLFQPKGLAWDLCYSNFCTFGPKEAASLTSSIRYVLSIATTLESYAYCSRYLARLSAPNKLTLLAPDSRGRQHSSRIGFSVAADINSNVSHFCFLVCGLSRLLCCVVSGSSVAAAYRSYDHHSVQDTST